MALQPLGVQVRPYRDYLTPALHRRFNKASRYTLLLCYIIACWMGEWNSPLWIWFPIGPTGIRTLLIFLPALVIYVLRVAQWHVGERQTQTRSETFQKYFLRKSTFFTLAFYVFSAWIYSEVYIWSRSSKSRLGFTDAGRAHERFKLNERPFFLRFLFVVLAITQAAIHLWDDYDLIQVPSMKPKQVREDKDTTTAASVRGLPKPRQVLVKQLPNMVGMAGYITGTALSLGTAVYFVGPRSTVWDYYYSFSRLVISLAKTSKPTGLAPFLPLVFGFFTEGMLLVFLWQVVNKAFDLYITQEPLKNDLPITTDSRDPNGTLLNGLRSKKEAVKAIAFWELALITDAFPDRRKTMYGELERKKAPTYQQITSICLGEVKLLIERLQIGLNPTYSPAPMTDPKPSVQPVNLVPQISQPLRNDKQIAALPPAPSSRWEHIEAATSGIAKLHSTPGNAQQAYGRDVINKGAKKVQEGTQQAETLVTQYYNKLMSSYLVVLGAPYSRISLICNAVTALTNLTTFSIKCDDLGRFNQGVPDIIRVFTMAIKMIDEYMAKVPIHWSDHAALNKPEAERKIVPEVEHVRECLRDGLEKIIGSFNEYLSSMGLSALEILDAKKAVGVSKAPEILMSGAQR